MNSLTVLGSGTSTGVPMIGCNCRVCNSSEPANNRLRTSVLLTTQSEKNILIDTTPDLRTQFLRAQIQKIDAVIVTHDHADHTHGMDDLRPLCQKHRMSIPVYCSAATAQGLRQKFAYVFDRARLYPAERPAIGGGIPTLDLNEISPGTTEIVGAEFEFFTLPHGYHFTTGFRHRGLAYLVDCHDVPQEILEKLRDAQLEWLILDCVQPAPHQTHLGWDKARKILEFVRPKRAGLIHMNHHWDHQEFIQVIKDLGIDWAMPLKDGDVLQYL